MYLFVTFIENLIIMIIITGYSYLFGNGGDMTLELGIFAFVVVSYIFSMLIEWLFIRDMLRFKVLDKEWTWMVDLCDDKLRCLGSVKITESIKRSSVLEMIPDTLFRNRVAFQNVFDDYYMFHAYYCKIDVEKIVI